MTQVGVLDKWQPSGSMISKEMLRGFAEVQEPTFLSTTVHYLHQSDVGDATTWGYL